MTKMLGSLTHAELLEIDQVITKEADEANAWMMQEGFAQADYDAVVKYRDGYCGVSSDCALNYLSQKGFDMNKIKKINPSGDHYLISDGTNILEPSYKQFLYTSVLDRIDSYNPKKGISKDTINKIDKLPGVFLGTSQELKEKITKTLIDINQAEKIESILGNYGLLIKDEQILSNESLASTSASSDDELQSPPLFSEKFLAVKKAHNQQQQTIKDEQILSNDNLASTRASSDD